MTDWIFLIQKEGDRTWQPLPTPILEIEENKYRIIAQTDISDLCVEVRIDVELLEKSASILPSCQTYFRRTNSQGLIIILPFTYFDAGLWQFSCCCDLMSELMGETWQVSRQILSLPKTGYHSLPNAYATVSPQEITLDLPEPLPHKKPLVNKILPPKLNLSSGKIPKKSPQLPKFPA